MSEHKATIDERLDRLTERHEALTQSVELLVREGHEVRESQKNTERILDKVVEGIERLARIALAHQGRISKLEDGTQS